MSTGKIEAVEESEFIKSAIHEEYVRLTPKSAEFQKKAEGLIAGGTSRGAGHWFPHPLTFEKGDGVYLTDLDGRTYIDLLGNYTVLVHGHRYPPIVEVVREQIEKGTCWSGNNTWQHELAEALVERIPSFDGVRFTNSGTEAANLALLIARMVTNRPNILMARYGYHGQVLETEIGSFDGFLTAPIDTTYLAPYNDAAAFEAVLAEHGQDIAAVFLEPVMGLGGIIEAKAEFLSRVKAAAHEAGALLVFDEVISLRLARGGLQETLGVDPDLTMLGKVIGGGFPVGAVGGRAEYMDLFDPAHPKLYHSGTFNGNPVTMAAGTISVRELTQERIDRMEAQGRTLETRLLASASKIGIPLSINRSGSLLNLFFSEKSPAATLIRQDQYAAGLFQLAALNHGLFLANRGLVALSTPMDDALIDEIADRSRAAMRDVASEAF